MEQLISRQISPNHIRASLVDTTNWEVLKHGLQGHFPIESVPGC